jgi:hypothetical protein
MGEGGGKAPALLAVKQCVPGRGVLAKVDTVLINNYTPYQETCEYTSICSSGPIA